MDERTNQPPDLNDPLYFDPPLTLKGKQVALEAGYSLQQWWKNASSSSSSTIQRPQLIVTSPLTRCIQTSLLVSVPGGDYCSVRQPPSFTLPARTIVVESLREACGMHQPDRRRSRAVLQQHWPLLDFDDDMPNEDVLWQPHQRETWQQVDQRVQSFLQWIVTRTEDSLLVVSHGVWMECCLRQYLLEKQQRVFNCDAFSCQIVSTRVAERELFVRLQNVQQIYGYRRRSHAGSNQRS